MSDHTWPEVFAGIATVVFVVALLMGLFGVALIAFLAAILWFVWLIITVADETQVGTARWRWARRFNRRR